LQASDGENTDTFGEPVQELSSFLEVSGGSPQRQNSWALRDCLPCSGRVSTWLWGRNDFGQLGSGGTSDQGRPQRVEALAGKEVVLVAGNLYNTAFLLGETSFHPYFVI